MITGVDLSSISGRPEGKGATGAENGMLQASSEVENPFCSWLEGLGSVVSCPSGVWAELKINLVLSITERFWWNDSVASKWQNFFSIFLLSPDVILSDRIGTFILATLLHYTGYIKISLSHDDDDADDRNSINPATHTLALT